MGRRRLTTAEIKARGSHKHNPSLLYDRIAEPKINGKPGPAPKHLSANEKVMWDELLEIAFPGVLSAADRWTLEATVKLAAKMRYEFDSMSTAQIKEFANMLGRLGMTPADRSRVQQPEEFREPKRSLFGKLRGAPPAPAEGAD